MHRRPPVLRTAALSLALGITACAPVLDWRDVRPEGSGATLLMPCKPTSLTRDVQLAGAGVRLALSACSAGGQTWALGFADVGAPARVGPALDALRAAALANVGAVTAQPLPLAVAGATPNASSQRLRIDGHLSDGKAVQMQAAVFSRGTVVYQATVLGGELPADAAETFFGALRLGS